MCWMTKPSLNVKSVILLIVAVITLTACAISPTSYCSQYAKGTKLRCSGDTVEKAILTLSTFAEEKCETQATLGAYEITIVPRETQAYVNNSWINIGGTYYRVSAPYFCD